MGAKRGRGGKGNTMEYAVYKCRQIKSSPGLLIFIDSLTSRYEVSLMGMGMGARKKALLFNINHIFRSPGFLV